MNLPAWQQRFADGSVLLIDKPLRWTSFDAVKKVRILTGISKVGHAGTLDPLATGLLIICTGKFTKRINEYMAREKEYTGQICLGATTPTCDLESEPENFTDISGLKEEDIRAAARHFTGEIDQVPPAHSAVKKYGKPSYQLARKGVEVKLEPRKIMIHEFEITQIALPLVSFRVVCSTGTYIRSVARDIGEWLGCGGYLASLRRTRIGNSKVEDAWDLADFEGWIKQLKTDAQKG